jgi:RNA polymerase sigma-70 factor, ECF subfamily
VQTQEGTPMPNQEIADGVLVQQALAGDQGAFETLVHRYETSLFNIIYQHVGEYYEAWDVLQEVLLQLYLSLATLRSSAQIGPWLFTVARNRCVDVLRRRRLTYFSELARGNGEDEATSLASIPDASPQPEELVERRELQQCVQRAIQVIPVRYRPVVSHYIVANLSFSEIGRVLNLPSSTVKNHFYRARPFLRAALETQLHITADTIYSG